VRLLAEHEDEHELVAHRPIYLRSPAPAAPAPPPVERPFERLDVERVTAVHASTGRGISEVSLHVARGELVVITGAVGSGKTTLVRTVLGLLPIERGTVRWNGDLVGDPGELLVPPRAAYAAQVPKLWSASLRENLQLGWAVDDDGLHEALGLARLSEDVAEMTDGLETLVGPRGVRLSGGQIQRALAARALVRQPELLIVDDLSSALDVETEQALWNGLLSPDRTGPPHALLVVSHRPAVLARADRVVTLAGGRIVEPGAVASVG
jgi:ATP-binding cassette subfamily B protein